MTSIQPITPARPGRRPAARAFTLAELMIAIGIMGVGLVMVMALFPAALKENANSIHDVIGGLICKNAIAIAKSQLRNGPGAGTVSTFLSGTPRQFQNITGTLIAPTGLLSDGYPYEIGNTLNASGSQFDAANHLGKPKGWSDHLWAGYFLQCSNDFSKVYEIADNNLLNPGTPTAVMRVDLKSNLVPARVQLTSSASLACAGFCLLARQVSPPNNDYQFMAIAYQKEDVLTPANILHQVTVQPITGDFKHEDLTVTPPLPPRFEMTVGDMRFIKLGTPVILNDSNALNLPNNGAYATVIAISGNTAILDRDILPVDVLGAQFGVVYEYQGNTIADETDATKVIGIRSPVISVLVNRTSLRP